MKTEEDRTKNPRSRIGLAIAAVILFFPTGISALIRAIKAQMASKRGDIDLAWELTDSSVSRSRLSIILGTLFCSAVAIFYTYTILRIMLIL